MCSSDLLSASAKDVLAKIYGDLDAYLETKIEAEVRAQKQQDGTVSLGEPVVASFGEVPDVTTVAATTAAATAAAVVHGTSQKEHPAQGTGSPWDLINAHKE